MVNININSIAIWYLLIVLSVNVGIGAVTVTNGMIAASMFPGTAPLPQYTLPFNQTLVSSFVAQPGNNPFSSFVDVGFAILNIFKATIFLLLPNFLFSMINAIPAMLTMVGIASAQVAVLTPILWVGELLSILALFLGGQA
jgi:hypothetical protein